MKLRRDDEKLRAGSEKIRLSRRWNTIFRPRLKLSSGRGCNYGQQSENRPAQAQGCGDGRVFFATAPGCDTMSVEACSTPQTAGDLAGLLAATAREDRSAFATLYQATSRKLYGVVLKIVWRREIADDILQDAYLRIWRNAKLYDRANGSPITWMAAIARNAAIDTVRRRQRARIEHSGDDSAMLGLAADIPDPLDEIAMARERHRALCAFKQLDREKRELILAAYLQGQSREQLAARFGIPVNTLKSRLHRALAEFRNGLEAAAGAARAA